ncbi:MAG: LacI family DNA-binding transcriptional regulator [Janthinobacterium lividum]
MVRHSPARVTQQAIAERLEVSQALVSLVMSGRAGKRVPQDTQDRILATASELGYVPDRSAQMLRLRRTRTIACVVPDITNPFYPALERGVQEAALEAGYDVIAINTDGLHARERQLIVWARQGRVDGIIGVFFALTDQELEEMASAGVAVVSLGSRAPESDRHAVDHIYTDNAGAAVTATEYLIARGHVRILAITSRGGPGPDREAGYRRAMQEAGLPVWIEHADDFTANAGQATMRRLLAGDVPTAVFAANDLIAAGVILALHEAGLRIPEQVAVVGFDDIDLARLLYPALTTIRLFQRETGLVAARRVVARLDTHDPSDTGFQLKRPFELVIRQSA